MENGISEPGKKMASPWQKAKMREHDIECPDWFTYDDAYEVIGLIFDDNIAEAKELDERKKKDHEYLGLELDEEQKKAARYPYDKPLLVSAGPGAGKTRVVVERVKDLILNQGLKDDQILCMTFTKAAQEEMTRRLKIDKDLKGHNLGYQVRTFHSLCKFLTAPFKVFDIIEQDTDNDNPNKLTLNGERWRTEFERLFGYNNEQEWKNDKQEGHFGAHKFKQLDSKDKDTFLELVNAVSAFKTEDRDVEDLEAYLNKQENIGDDPYLQRLEDLKKYFNAYKKYLINLEQLYNKKTKEWEDIPKPSYENNVTLAGRVKDFDDFLLDTLNQHEKDHRLIQPYEIYNKKYGSKLKHIIIDEFQDNNYLQFELAKGLAKGEAKDHITVVGDKNQSIYTFQGANPEIFNNFKEVYKDAKQIHLKHNYRSTPQIVELANKLLKEGRYSTEKDPYVSITKNDSGKKIQIKEFCDTKDEYDFFREVIIDKIGKKFQRRGDEKLSEITFGDFVILARTNAIRLQIHAELVKRGIPTVTKKFHRLEYPKDGSPYSKILGRFRQHLEPNSYLSELVEKLGGKFDSKAKLSDDENALPYKVLYYLASCYMKEYGDVTLQKFYDYITKFNPKTPRKNIGDGVEIRTAHSVKGEEFPFVIVSSSYQEHFPLEYRERELKVPPEYLRYQIKNCMICDNELVKQKDVMACSNPSCDANIEKELHRMEERRLYYVGITRAMNELFITVPKKTYNKIEEKWEEEDVSRFLIDLDYNTDPENIDWEDRCESVKMSAEEIDKMYTQHKQRWKDEKQQWKDEFDKRYEQVVNENRRLREQLEKILAGGGSDSEKEKLQQRIQELERELRDSEREKGKHSTFDESENSWEILELQPDSSVEQIKKAFQKFSLFWHPDKHQFATPARKEHAEMQFKRIRNAYDDLMKK